MCALIDRSSADERETSFPLRRAEGGRRSRGDGFERGLELLERAHDRNCVSCCLERVAFALHEAEKVLALEAKRLRGSDLRAVDVAGASPPVVVDRDLAVALHIV